MKFGAAFLSAALAATAMADSEHACLFKCSAVRMLIQDRLCVGEAQQE
jgi:hypothetical protein